MNLHPPLLFLHVVAVVVWVGGMFFAYVCLRPAAVAVLDPPLRLKLWHAVFARFFVWVWAAVALIPLTGLIMIGNVGFAVAPRSWHLMMAVGLVMVGIYIYVFLGPYAALRRAVDANDWPAGGAALGKIRQWVGVNLSLGLLTVAIATLGRGLA